MKYIQGLRVVDNSIMPKIIRGNTGVPAIMIGEKASDIIKETIHCHENSYGRDYDYDDADSHEEYQEFPEFSAFDNYEQDFKQNKPDIPFPINHGIQDGNEHWHHFTIPTGGSS